MFKTNRIYFKKKKTRKNEDCHPLTLKYNSRSNYCSRHKPTKHFGWLNLFSKKPAPGHKKCFSMKTKKRFIENDKRGISSMNDDMIDNLTTTCIKCMSEDPNLSKFSETLEQQYNKQTSPMFKYHLLMCSLLFLSIVLVLFISDFKK